MTRKEIEDILAQTDRWGTNYQPYLYEMADFLEQVNHKCGLKSLKVVSPDSIEFTTKKPLTPSLAFELGQLVWDGYPEDISDTQTNFVLWWD